MSSIDERTLRAVLDAAPIGFVLFDAQGCIVQLSPRAATWDREPARALVGTEMPEDFPGWLSAEHAAEARASIRRRERRHWVGPAAQSGGWLATTVMPLESGVMVWVSEVAAAASASGEAEAAHDASGATPRRTVHDLMQPLGAISNYAELIRRQSSDAVQGYAGEIARIALSMAATIRARR